MKNNLHKSQNVKVEQAINDQIYKTIHRRKKELWKFKLLVLNSVDVALKTK